MKRAWNRMVVTTSIVAGVAATTAPISYLLAAPAMAYFNDGELRGLAAILWR